MTHFLHRNHVVMPADPRLDVLIPHAQRFEHNGQQMMLVPHKLDETKVLRNLGYDVKPPILTDYNWCGSTPFDSQRITAALITMNPRCYVLNAIGTGKTRASLFAFDYLRSIGAVKKLLVVAPLSTLRRTWEAEVFMHLNHLRVAVLFGPKQKRLDLLKSDADVYIINHDGVQVILKELMASDIDMCVFDELSVYKDGQTKRFKDTLLLSRMMKRVVGMTGTPIPNAPTDAYAQTKLVDPTKTAQISFTRFRERTMRKITEYKWVPLDNALQTVHAFMQPSVRFTRDECYDLPDCQYITRQVDLTPQQQALYVEVAGECAAEIAGGTLKAVNEADRINKLTQIALGTVYNTDHQVVTLPCEPRLAAVEELVEQADSKVIVFTPYKASLAMLVERLKKRWSVAHVSGDVGPGERDKIFYHFMNDPDPHVLVAHPACMSHGLTLTAASTIVWYGPPGSLETYEQANGRITRAGQRHKQLIAHIAATKLEEKVYRRLEARSTVQGLLLEMYENQDLGDLL